MSNYHHDFDEWKDVATNFSGERWEGSLSEQEALRKIPDASAMNKVRYNLSIYVLWFGYLLAPRLMRPVLTSMLDAFAELPRQIESGRQGGLMMAPWYISIAGKDLARTQLSQCTALAFEIRQNKEKRENYLDTLIGLEPNLEP